MLGVSLIPVGQLLHFFWACFKLPACLLTGLHHNGQMHFVEIFSKAVSCLGLKWDSNVGLHNYF